MAAFDAARSTLGGSPPSLPRRRYYSDPPRSPPVVPTRYRRSPAFLRSDVTHFRMSSTMPTPSMTGVGVTGPVGLSLYRDTVPEGGAAPDAAGAPPVSPPAPP